MTDHPRRHDPLGNWTVRAVMDVLHERPTDCYEATHSPTGKWTGELWIEPLGVWVQKDGCWIIGDLGRGSVDLYPFGKGCRARIGAALDRFALRFAVRTWERTPEQSVRRARHEHAMELRRYRGS